MANIEPDQSQHRNSLANRSSTLSNRSSSLPSGSTPSTANRSSANRSKPANAAANSLHRALLRLPSIQRRRPARDAFDLAKRVDRVSLTLPLA